MAKCDFCGEDMLEADGCDWNFEAIVRSDKKIAKRIRFGTPEEHFGDVKPGERCHDCNAKQGELHHPGCDVERCPFCGGQFISCDCNLEVV